MQIIKVQKLILCKKRQFLHIHPFEVTFAQLCKQQVFTAQNSNKFDFNR